MTENVSPTPRGRKPLPSTPRARGFEAQRVRNRRLNDGSTAVRAVNDHIRGLPKGVETVRRIAAATGADLVALLMPSPN